MKSIKDLRAEFDALDDELVALLERRFTLSRQIHEVKVSLGLQTEDLAREAHVKDHVSTRVIDKSLSRPVLGVYEAIINLSKQVQEEDD